MKTLQDLDQAINQATTSASLAPARFAILLKPTQDPVAKRAEIAAKLSTAQIDFPSPQETRILIAEFPNRSFTAQEKDIFGAAYVMTDVLDVDAVEPDLPTAFFPQPPRRNLAETAFASTCWAPDEPALKPRWALDAMRIPDAWQFSVQKQRPDRGAGIIIAQPDTGITDHFELKNVIESNPANILDHTLDPTDPLTENPQFDNPGHGTGTASVAVSPEADTVYGSAPKATHMSIRAINSVIRISQVTVAAAVDWAIDHGAHIITMSLGGIPSFTLQRSIRRAIGADIIVMAAAGNCVKFVVWPARYEDCLAVAGTDSIDQPWRGTCKGSAVSISAPAQNVFRAHAAKGEPPTSGQGQGTSFAVALTAGAAADWLAHYGRANIIAAAHARGETVQVMFKRLLKATARRPANWDSFNMGAGIVDARALLEADFDLGRERESAPVPDNAADRANIAIQSLVLEATQHAEAVQPDLDWGRYGPEIAFRILRNRQQETAPAATPVTKELDGSAENRQLRAALGLPPQEVRFE